MSFNKSFYAHYFLLLELLFYKYDLVFFDYCCNMTKMFFYTGMQCFRSGSGWIRIIWSDPDLYQEALIWIRVAPKDYSGKKSIFFKIFNFFVTYRPVSEYII